MMRCLVTKSSAPVEGATQRPGRGAVRRIQPAVSRRHCQTVAFAKSWCANDLYRDMQITHHTTDHMQLLIILFPQKPPDRVEQY